MIQLGVKISDFESWIFEKLDKAFKNKGYKERERKQIIRVIAWQKKVFCPECPFGGLPVRSSRR